MLAIFTCANADHGWTVDNEGEAAIAKLVVDSWSPSGIDGKTPISGLGLPADVVDSPFRPSK